VDRLRGAASEQHQSSRVVRIATVNTATVPLVMPVIERFRQEHPATQVEVVGSLHADVQRALLEGSIDLGLVNYLEGDDMPPDLENTPLLAGRAVACMRPDNARSVVPPPASTNTQPRLEHAGSCDAAGSILKPLLDVLTLAYREAVG
jgi:DNA-binding transcriptional LysR family regulator